METQRFKSRNLYEKNEEAPVLKYILNWFDISHRSPHCLHIWNYIFIVLLERF